MSELLVLIDHSDGAPKKLSLQMLSAAAGLADDADVSVSAVWLGAGASDAAATIGAHGATKLYHWDSEDAHGYVTLPQVEGLQAAIEASGADVVFFASTNHVKDVASRLAIRVGGGVITDVTGLRVEDGRFVATKEVFGGDMITTSRVADGHVQILGIANNAFPAQDAGGDAPELVALDVDLSEAATAAKVVSVEKQVSADRPDIAEAAVVVAGGRGLGNEDGFQLMEQLADVLGAGVGA
ncbi:MAG: electron transfer flavoprotein subunit alpha/FixB family protein, partial [Nitriliruptor sp.]